jgi:NADPH:quinone reductase-like Zn-dependent oxidoreductase/acyl carrier protein
LSEAEGRTLLAKWQGEKVDIAAVNGPTSLTFSGDSAILQDIADKLDKDGIFQRALQVEVAYHSPYMDPLMPEMRAALSSLQPKTPHIPLYSTVTGGKAESSAYGAEYWCQNARQAVLFAPAMMALLNDGHDRFLEVGPHPVLSTSIKQCASEAKKTIRCIATLNRKTAEVPSFYLSLAELYATGCALNWAAHFPTNARYELLPSYPWQNTRYWSESAVSLQDRTAKVEHPLLGMRSSSPQALWSNKLNMQLQGWLPDHCVEDLVVLPGAAYVELGLASHHALHQKDAWVLEDLHFFNALIVSDGDEPEVRTQISSDGKQFAIHSKGRDSDTWQAHARGRLSFMPAAKPGKLQLEKLIDQMQNKQDHATHYHNMTARKLQYGPSFQGVQEVWQTPENILARVALPRSLSVDANNYFLHPALLDACFQSLLSVLSPQDKRAFVPTHIRQIRYHGKPESEIWCYGSIDTLSQDTLVGDLILCNAHGEVQVELRGIKAVSLSQAAQLSERELDDWLYEFEWQELESERARREGRWLLIGDLDTAHSRASQTLDNMLAAGCEVELAHYGDRFEKISGAHRDSFSQHYVAPHGTEDYRALFATLSSAHKYAGVVCFVPPVSDNSVVSAEKTLAALAMLQGFARSETTAITTIIYVTENAQPVNAHAGDLNLNETGVVSLLRTAANEYQNVLFRNIDVDATTTARALANEILCAADENETLLRGDQRLAKRMVRRCASDIQARCNAAAEASAHYRVHIDTTETWLQALVSEQDADGKDSLMQVQASTLSRKELYSEETQRTHYNMQTRLFLGEVLASNIESLIAKTALVFSLEAPANQLAVNNSALLMPETETPIDAQNLGSILTYTAAHKIVRDIAQLQAGENILIHEADSALGLAAVYVAHALQANIFVTVKDSSIAEQLIQLGIAGCYSYDTLAFSEDILTATHKQGVDVVLNPFDGEIAEHSMQLVKTGGRLLDFSGTPLLLKPGVQCNSLSVDRDILQNNASTKAAVLQVCKKLGAQYPLIDTQVWNVNLLAERQQHISQSIANTLEFSSAASAQLFKRAAMHIDAKASYLITGGFGGFGKELVRLLAQRGAKHLIIVSRSGAKTQNDLALLAELKDQGIQVIAPKLDIADSNAVAELFTNTLAALPPIKGVIHTAGVLDDCPVNFMDAEKLARVMSPKVHGAWNLHENTRTQKLDFFVTFSSIASMIGAAGQGTYVISNVWLDSFAAWRQAQGLPATAISWGALADVGMAAVDAEVVAYFERVGLRPISPVKAMAGFERILQWGVAHLGFADIDWSLWASYYPAWGKSPRYRHLVHEAKGTNEGNDWLQALAQKSEDEQIQDVLQRLIIIVAGAMKLPAEKIGGGDSLPKLGIDSLIAMELQTVIHQALGLRLSTLELMKGNSLQQMSAHICCRLAEQFSVAATLASAPVENSNNELDIDALDESQLDEMLAVLSAN